jgi:hypothetical protein
MLQRICVAPLLFSAYPFLERIKLMSPSDEDLAPLFISGTIRLPSPFPAVGELEIRENGAAHCKDNGFGALLIVRRRVWPSTKVCWTMRAECVSAILLTKGDELDYATAKWVFAPSVPKLGSIAETKVPRGIVFVPENTPVLMRIEFGTTASESADYPIPGPVGGCDPHSPSFSYESVMAGPDKG